MITDITTESALADIEALHAVAKADGFAPDRTPTLMFLEAVADLNKIIRDFRAMRHAIETGIRAMEAHGWDKADDNSTDRGVMAFDAYLTNIEAIGRRHIPD